MWDDLWGIIWFFFWIFAFCAYLIALFSIVADIFRDHSLNGWAKALWIIFLVFVPFLTALVYVIARGQGMSERGQKSFTDTDLYPAPHHSSRSTASAADEIAKAKGLLDSGTITQAEFDSLKSRALA
jgi:hypothetical protein